MHQCVIKKIGKEQNWGGISLVITIFLYFKLNIILEIIQKQQFHCVYYWHNKDFYFYSYICNDFNIIIPEILNS